MKRIEEKTKTMIRLEVIHKISIEEMLRVKYVDENKSIEQIGDELDLSPATVHKWLHLAGITTRQMKWE